MKWFSLWVSKLDITYFSHDQSNCPVQTDVKISGMLSEQARSAQGLCFVLLLYWADRHSFVAKHTRAREFCSMQQLIQH